MTPGTCLNLTGFWGMDIVPPIDTQAGFDETEPVRMTVEGTPDSRSRNGVTGVSRDVANVPATWAWRGLVFWLAVMIGGHAVVLNEPFVNQEVAFSEGARGLAEADYPDGLTRFWRHQVNPLGYSAATALIRTVLNQSDSYWTARLASLASAVS